MNAAAIKADSITRGVGEGTRRHCRLHLLAVDAVKDRCNDTQVYGNIFRKLYRRSKE